MTDGTAAAVPVAQEPIMMLTVAEVRPTPETEIVAGVVEGAGRISWGENEEIPTATQIGNEGEAGIGEKKKHACLHEPATVNTVFGTRM